MRMVVIYEPKLITYVSEDKLFFIGKFVLFYISLQRCRGPPHTQKFTNFEYVGGFIYV